MLDKWNKFELKKIKTLLLPFILSNLLVISIVIIAKLLGYDYLNRISFDSMLLIEGLFSLRSEPINPPTYFIRDIFLLFCVISLFRKNYYSIIFILPYLLFGKFFIRIDVISLFIIGWGISISKEHFKSKKPLLSLILICLLLISLYFQLYFSIKFLLAILIFILFFNKKVKFFNVGGYSYLLHLYHAPIIVMIYPFLSFYIKNEIALVVFQFLIAAIIVLCLYRFLKFQNIKIFTGGRL